MKWMALTIIMLLGLFLLFFVVLQNKGPLSEPATQVIPSLLRKPKTCDDEYRKTLAVAVTLFKNADVVLVYNPKTKNMEWAIVITLKGF